MELSSKTTVNGVYGQQRAVTASGMGQGARLNDFRERGNRIECGDRLFVRVTRNGMTVAELMTDKVSTMTDLLAEVRMSTKGRRGLMKLYVRNHSRGWSMERPLMLYASAADTQRQIWRNQAAGMPAGVADHMLADAGSVSRLVNRPHMVFPWETH